MRVLYIDVKSDMQTCLMAVAQLEIEIDACKLAKSIITKENIDCNFEKVNSYIVNNNNYKFIKT